MQKKGELDMKVLFITHSGDLTYGAAKSLNLLLENTTVSFDIIFGKYIFKNETMDDIVNYVGPKVNNIYFANLPLNYEILQINDLKNLRQICSKIYRFFLYRKDKTKITKLIKNGNYDIIHLNSSILYPLITKQCPTIIHIRELLKPDISRKAVNKFKQAAGIIQIDNSVHMSLSQNFTKVNMPLNIILNNPFKISRMDFFDKPSLYAKYNIGKQIVFLIAGVIDSFKGVDFVTDAFQKCDRKDIILLVAGNPNTKLATELIRKNSNDERIRFIGEQKNMEEIYAITDYLVRADPIFCTGRTIYEALYSGCKVLMQGTQENYNDINCHAGLRDEVHFYSPRDTNSFVSILQNLNKPHRKNQIVNDNVKEFIDSFESFLDEVLERWLNLNEQQ